MPAESGYVISPADRTTLPRGPLGARQAAVPGLRVPGAPPGTS